MNVILVVTNFIYLIENYDRKSFGSRIQAVETPLLRLPLSFHCADYLEASGRAARI